MLSKSRKLTAILLAVMIALGLFAIPPLVLTVNAAADFEVSNAAGLKTALSKVQTGQVIKLLNDFDYTDGILIGSKRITFDLNGCKLNVSNPNKTVTSFAVVLEVQAGGEVKLTDSTGGGELNINGDMTTSGVGALYGGRVTVTNVKGIAGVGAALGGIVTVTGDVTGYETGVFADGNDGELSLVEIGGNVTAEDTGVEASGAIVHVAGNVTAGKTGVASSKGGVASINGNVTVKAGSGSRGFTAYNGGTVIVDGYLNLESGVYFADIQFEKVDQSDGVDSVSKQGYTEYTVVDPDDGETGTVLIKKIGTYICAIDAVKYPTLNGAIAAVGTGESKYTVIKLLQDITYNGSLIINNKKIAFDTDGHELKVVSITGTALTVTGGGLAVILRPAEGAFRVAGYDCGVAASGGSKVFATSATAYGNYNSRGVIADGADTEVTIYGTVALAVGAASNYGVYADGGAQVDVGSGGMDLPAGAGYILAGTKSMAKKDWSFDPAKPDHYKYTDGTSTVWVYAGHIALAITSADNTSVESGKGGTFQVEVIGTNPITYSLINAPAGVSINSTSGLITIADTVAVKTHNFTIKVSDGTNPDAFQSFTLTVTEPTNETTTLPGLKGDINGDGKVNGMDLLLMKQHILDIPGKKIEISTAAFIAADMNDDGRINGMDLLLLKKKILT